MTKREEEKKLGIGDIIGIIIGTFFAIGFLIILLYLMNERRLYNNLVKQQPKIVDTFENKCSQVFTEWDEQFRFAKMPPLGVREKCHCYFRKDNSIVGCSDNLNIEYPKKML